MELDDHVCYCFHISKRKILNFIRIHEPKRASMISQCGSAGTGCGWCVPYLIRYFEQEVHDRPSDAPELIPEEYAKQRAAYIADGKGTPPPGAAPLPDADDGDD